MGRRFARISAFLLFLVMTFVGAWVALDRVGRLGETAAGLREQPFSLAEALVRAHDRAFHAQEYLRDAVIETDHRAQSWMLSLADWQANELNHELEIVATRYADQPTALSPLLMASAEWRAIRFDVSDLLASGRRAEAELLLDTRGETAFRGQHQAMLDVLDTERLRVGALRADALEAQRSAEIVAIGLSVLAAGAMVAAAVGYSAFTRAHRPLMRLRATLLALADGRIGSPVPLVDQPGAVGSLARAVERIQHSLSERDSAMAAMRLSEERLKAALAIAPVAVFNLDRDFRYTWLYNPQIGLPAATFIGRTGADFFEPEGYAQRERLFRHVLATGEPASEPIALRVKGTSEDRHYLQMAAPMRQPDGTIIGLTCAAVDVTDRERGKAALQEAADEARRANAAKSRFLAAASHDLRQPVQALRLFLDTLDLQLVGSDDRRALGGALAALGGCEDLLRSFLDVSLLEAGLVRPDPQTFSIADLLHPLAREFAPIAAAKGLEFRLASCGYTVNSDPLLLGNLLRNLVTNAVRYTDQGAVLVGCRRTGATLRIEVWDTGVGIPPDKLTAVFEDFYQIGNLERDRTKGLGLGLSVVDRTSRLLGHPVTASSRPGHGSVFAVTVPLARMERTSKRDAA